MKFTDKQKNSIREVLDRDEGVTAEELAEEVRAAGTVHPLYALIFDCHESAAAWRYYVERTRLVIRSYVHVVPKPGTEEKLVVRGGLHVKIEEREAYRSTAKVLQIPDGYDQIRQRAVKQLDSWQQKYTGLLGDAFVIEAVRAKLAELLNGQEDEVEHDDHPRPDSLQ